jgi:peptidoglycan/xylan/chitin deacetylase (PgdA/CDA1 family)
MSYFFKNTIINFHDIYDMQWMDMVFQLLKSRYQIVSLNEIKSFYYENHKLENSCHITFDDGDISFFTIVYPLLIKHNITASIYVSPSATICAKNFWFQTIRGFDKKTLLNLINSQIKVPIRDIHSLPLGSVMKSLPLEAIHSVISIYEKENGKIPKQPMNLNINQLRELHASGIVSIGAHTQNHPILANESDEVARYEIQTSVQELGELLGTQIEYFAFPNGKPTLDFGQREIKYLKESGIKIAFSTQSKNFDKHDDPLSIPRIPIQFGNESFILLKLLSGGKWEYLRKMFKGKQEDDYRFKILNQIVI